MFQLANKEQNIILLPSSVYSPTIWVFKYNNLPFVGLFFTIFYDET